MIDKYRCLECGKRHIPETKVIFHINEDSEWVYHCPYCYSTQIIYENYCFCDNPIKPIDTTNKLTDEM